MWPDSKEAWCTGESVFGCAAKTLRLRGAAAAQTFFLSAGGERRCIVQALSDSSFGAFGRVFVSAARKRRRTHAGAKRLRSLALSVHAPACKSRGGCAAGAVASDERKQLR
jgi:hypothetical protein